MDIIGTDPRPDESDFDVSLLQADPEDQADPVDEYGLPFEAGDEYSCGPLEFEELAENLLKDLETVCQAAARYNRQSPYYMMLCDHLEKDIKMLGSFCVTKAVLEQKGFTFPKLEGLDIPELYTVVSFHFRKCHTAFQDQHQQFNALDLKLLERVCRWAQLSERLKATEEKIQKIREGKISADRILDREQVFKGNASGTHPQRNPREIQKSSALPFLSSYARELVRKKRQEEAKKAREERQRKRQARQVGPYRGFRPARPFPPESISVYEGSLRKMVMEAAELIGDEEGMRSIPTESLAELEERSKRYPEKLSSASPPPGARPGSRGPSAEVRKKLREKRKKKK